MNKAYNPDTIRAFREEIAPSGLPYRMNDEAGNTPEYAEFQFIGRHEERDVLCDTALYTLRLQHESELFEIAEKRAMAQFPDYKKVTEGDGADPEKEEEIGLFMAEVIMELEEEEAVKVQEHIDIDTSDPSGVSLDVGLHVEVVTPDVILNFVNAFNADTLVLDDTRYSFQTGEEGE
jgi:hypothetical protein